MIGEYRPDPTTGALSGQWGLAANGVGLPVDQHDDDVRALTATSAPLPDPLVVCGRAEVTVEVADPYVERLVVRLTDVDPDGRSFFLAAGVLCRGEGTRHRVTLWPIAHRVAAGHRLRVVVSDSDFPRLMPLPSPAVLRVTGIDVTVPAVPDDTGVPAILPLRERPESSATSRWEVTRDLVNDGVEVLIGGDSGVTRTSEGHRLETRSLTTAKVRRAAPAAVVVSRTSDATVRFTTGELVEVSATVRCTQTALWARGRVTVDGEVVTERHWHLLRL